PRPSARGGPDARRQRAPRGGARRGALVEPLLAGDLLRVDLGSEHRCLASTVLGGGLGAVRTWVNLQVPSDYARTDPGAHLAEVTAGFPGPVVGLLTAAPVDRFPDVTVGPARRCATLA